MPEKTQRRPDRGSCSDFTSGRFPWISTEEWSWRQIPYGKAATYGQIALLCGMPKHARQVGYALRTGKAGEVCAHRVVNARGILSGAASFDTPDQQKLLLEAEGVPVEWTPEGYRVNLKESGWKNTMEEAEALRARFDKEEI